MMMNKETFYDHASRVGLPIPETFPIRTREQAEEVAHEVTYPCILKPPLRLRRWSRHTKDKGFVARSPSELLEHYDRSRDWTEALIAQRLIPGGDSNHFTCNCYIDRSGEPQVVFTSRKLRQWPPKTGQACLAEEVENDVVVRETLRAYASVEYCGLGYLEMKQDAVTGEYLIIEPNVGRPTGRSALAEAAGVELLYTMYCDASGLPLPENRTQRSRGIKWIHVLRDLQAAHHHWRRGELTCREWWRSVKGPKVCAVFSWRDPRPLCRAVVGAIGAVRAGRERDIAGTGG
jgi:predicted ATP-grasp superfamily ATP-dependent carboligase